MGQDILFQYFAKSALGLSPGADANHQTPCISLRISARDLGCKNKQQVLIGFDSLVGPFLRLLLESQTVIYLVCLYNPYYLQILQ